MKNKIAKRCPLCNEAMVKVIYAGLPGKLCPNEWCAVLTGPAVLFASVYFNGIFVVYEDCGYPRALFHWMFS